MTEAPPGAGANWEFDGFTVLSEMRLLLHGGVAIPLTSKAFDTLAILIAHRERVVSKDELLRSVWPDVVVEEGNLTQQIFLLRKALGETAQQSRYIVTVPGHGYRFTARVKAAPGDAASPLPPASTPRARSIGMGYVAVGAIVLLAIVLGIAWRARDDVGQPVDLAKARVTRITETGKATESAASADGRYVAYVEDDGDQQSVWVTHKRGGGPTMVVPRESTVFANLTFTVDGEFLYFTRSRPSLGVFGLSRVPVNGGVENPILDDVDTPVSFSPDGLRLAFTRGTETGVDVVVAAANGESPQALPRLKSPLGFAMVSPDWSPVGNMLAVVAVEPRMTVDRWSIQLVPLDGSPSRELYSTDSIIGRPRWLPDGSGLLVPMSEALTRQFPPWHGRHFRFSGGPIWRIGYPDGHAEQLTSDLVDHELCCLDLTADSAHVTGVFNSLVSDMWIAPADNLNARTQISSGAPTVTRHAWLRDNDTIVYRDVSGRLKAVRKDQSAFSISLPDGLKVAGGVSACGDGRYVVFRGAPGNNIWRASVNGGAPVALTHGTNDSNPACSPDGKRVMYSRGGWSASVWWVPIEGGEPAQMGPNESYDALPSPNGRLMYYSISHWDDHPVRTRSGVWIVTAIDDLKPLLRVPSPRLIAAGVPPVWAPGDSGLDYVVTTKGVSNIWRQLLTGGPPVPVTHYTSGKIFSFAWSPDGRWLSIAMGANRSDVVTYSR